MGDSEVVVAALAGRKLARQEGVERERGKVKVECLAG